MPVPARSWPARGSCASGKPGRPCPTCRFERSRFRAPSKNSALRSDAPSRQRSRHDAPSPQRSRHRSRPVARSRSHSHRVLAFPPPVRRRTTRAGERPELLARLKARHPRRNRPALAADEAWPSPPCPASRWSAPTDVTRASAFASGRSDRPTAPGRPSRPSRQCSPRRSRPPQVPRTQRSRQDRGRAHRVAEAVRSWRRSGGCRACQWRRAEG